MTLAMHRGPDVLKGRENRKFRLTAMQTPILLDQIFFPGKPIAHTGECVAINGAIDQKLFAEAIQRVVKETDALRVCLSIDGGTVYQEARDLPDYAIEQVNFSSEHDPEAAAQAWIEERFWTPIDWTAFPLFQFALLKIRDDRYIWLQKFNHVLIDGIGRSVLIRRTAEIYEAISTHVEPAPKIAVSAAETIEAEDSYLLSADHAADRDYWKARFASLPSPLVKTDRRETDRAKSGRATRLSFDIAPADLQRLKVLAKSLNSSAPRLCLAFAYLAFCRLYSVSDLVIGLTQHNRTNEASKQAIGLFMQTMPFRMSIGPRTAFLEALSEIDRTFLRDRSHSRFPFSSLGKTLGLESTGRSLADVIVNYLPKSSLRTFNAIPAEITNLSRGFFTPWLITIVEGEDSGAKVEIDYDVGLIEADEARRLFHCLQFLLTNDVSDTTQPIGRVPIMDAHERARSLTVVNQTFVAVPEDATLASLCAEQADRTPDAVAVVSGTENITYAELHRRASALAFQLGAMGTGPDVVVGIAMPRCIDLVVAVLAVHKAGGAYLPLDPAYPQERIAYILSDAKASVIITTSALAPDLPASDAKMLLADRLDWESIQRAAPRPTKNSVLPHHLAYVIYTSGSTGRPKGVSVEHRNAVNFILWARSLLDEEAIAGASFGASLNFDPSVFQLFAPLSAGGRIILVENLLQGPAAPAWDQVRFIDTVPSLMEELLKISGLPKHIRTITLVGETLTRSLADRIFAAAPDVRLFNCYGPTEITVYSNWSKVDPADRRPPAIGKPIWNTQLYVLGEDLELLPAGAPGELYIGGHGVARGYLNRPDLTQERFLKNPFGEGRLYRTGDLVRLRADGEFEFLGRTDTQVKISGLRVELGEIETQLETIPGISVAAAIVRPDSAGVNRLHAYAIAADENAKPEIDEVLARLRRVLPRHMIPSTVVWMKAFPYTLSGKLDRGALPRVEEPPKGLVHSFRKPRNDIEHALCQIWQQALNDPQIGIDDDFYELGGTSLQAFLIFARIAQNLGHDLPATTMLEASTIARQGALLHDRVLSPSTSKLITIRNGGVHSPLFLIHAVFGEIAYARELARHLKSDRPVFGLRPPKLDGTETVALTMEAIAADYIAEIRVVQQKGPYCLAGHSFGGWVAFEMAQQLVRQGETVDFLGLIDTYGKTAIKGPEKVAPRVARHVGALHKRSLRDMAGYIGIRAAKNLKYCFAVACFAARECLPAGIGQRFIKPPSYALRSDLYAGIYRTALRRYAPQPYGGNITTFSAMGLSKFHKQHWQPFALGELTVTEIPAGHQSIICSPHSEELAARFDGCLERTSPAIVRCETEAPPNSRRPDGMSASCEVAPSRCETMALTQA